MVYTKTINDNAVFGKLYRSGKKIVSSLAVVYYKPNRLPYNRLGITAGKKIGNAVNRNRAKRIIRTVYRENELQLPIGFDIVFVARRKTAEIKSTELEQFFLAGVVKELNGISG